MDLNNLKRWLSFSPPILFFHLSSHLIISSWTIPSFYALKISQKSRIIFGFYLLPERFSHPKWDKNSLQFIFLVNWSHQMLLVPLETHFIPSIQPIREGTWSSWFPWIWPLHSVIRRAVDFTSPILKWSCNRYAINLWDPRIICFVSKHHDDYAKILWLCSNSEVLIFFMFYRLSSSRCNQALNAGIEVLDVYCGFCNSFGQPLLVPMDFQESELETIWKRRHEKEIMRAHGISV